MVTTKQCKGSTISACGSIGRNIGAISKILIADIENILATDILLIRYIGTPLHYLLLV